jgi:hypothetical protein
MWKRHTVQMIARPYLDTHIFLANLALHRTYSGDGVRHNRFSVLYTYCKPTASSVVYSDSGLPRCQRDRMTFVGEIEIKTESIEYKPVSCVRRILSVGPEAAHHHLRCPRCQETLFSSCRSAYQSPRSLAFTFGDHGSDQSNDILYS